MPESIDYGVEGYLMESTKTRMSADTSMKVKAQKQGDIKGGCRRKGREGTFDIWTVEYGVESPRDAHSGLMIGKREHMPVVVYGELEVGFVQLHNAICNNENLPTVTLQFYRPPELDKAAAVKNENFFTITLTNASLSQLRQFTDHAGRTQMKAAFTFQKIELQWIKGGITSDDDWLTT
jgi:type VI secretion system secreted protein Hcp